MAPNTTGRKPNALVLMALAGLILLAILATYHFLTAPDTPPPTADKTGAADPSSQAGRADGQQSQRVIEYGQLDADEDLQNLMNARKKAYDVGESIDIIAKSDETLKIGENRISMRELQEQIRRKLGEISEETLGSDGQPQPGALETFGIHVVQPGDNLWNIHFAVLKDYFERRDVRLAGSADEPDAMGFSSGVGKLLKFSENIVYIYNVKTKAFSEDLNLIEPNSTLIVYKMDQVFDLLEQLDYRNIDRIQFDGDTLWVPTPAPQG
jgi:hypothetical protein